MSDLPGALPAQWFVGYTDTSGAGDSGPSHPTKEEAIHEAMGQMASASMDWAVRVVVFSSEDAVLVLRG